MGAKSRPGRRLIVGRHVLLEMWTANSRDSSRGLILLLENLGESFEKQIQVNGGLRWEQNQPVRGAPSRISQVLAGSFLRNRMGILPPAVGRLILIPSSTSATGRLPNRLK